MNNTPCEDAADADIDSLVEHAAEANAALMQGDIERYLSHFRISDDFCLMAPIGGPPTLGAPLTAQRWAEIGRFFSGGRDSTLELVRAYRSVGIVVLVVIERTVAEVGGLAAQAWALRVTLVFRQDDGHWQLVHRHADPLVEGISLEMSAALSAGRA